VLPEIIVSQGWLLVAVHCSSGSLELTVIVPLPPAGFAVAELGLMLRVPASCVTTSASVSPFSERTVTVAVLVTPVGFPATE